MDGTGAAVPVPYHARATRLDFGIAQGDDHRQPSYIREAGEFFEGRLPTRRDEPAGETEFQSSETNLARIDAQDGDHGIFADANPFADGPLLGRGFGIKLTASPAHFSLGRERGGMREENRDLQLGTQRRG